MNVPLVIVIGGIAGFLGGIGIFFEPKEPYKVEILFAAILKGILVSVITALSLPTQSRWWQAAGFGLLYGFAFALVIFLAKGGFKSKDALMSSRQALCWVLSLDLQFGNSHLAN